MNVTARAVLLVLALICFALAAIGLPLGRVNLLGAGLALLTAAELVT